MAKKSEIFVLDAGYGWSKWATRAGKVHVFPSLIAQAMDSTWDAGVGGSLAGHRLGFDGSDILVGRVAEIKAADARGNLSRKRAQTFEVLGLLYNALADAYPGGAEGIKLYSGLPVRWLSDRQHYEQTWPGEHTVVVDGETVTWDISEVNIAPQGFGPVMDVGFSYDGKKLEINDTDVLTGRTAVADFGTLTFNLFTFRQRTWQEHLSDSWELGMSWAIQRITPVLEAEFGTTFPPHEVDDAIRLGFVTIQGEEITTHRYTGPTLALLAEEAASRTKSKLGEEFDKINRVVIAGGGAHRLATPYKRVLGHRNAEVVSDPQSSNAKGFLNWGLASEV